MYGNNVTDHMKKFGIAILGLALALASCSPYMVRSVNHFPVYSDAKTQHICHVNSIGNYNMRDKSFYVEVGKPDMDGESAEFKAMAGHLAKALAVQGAKVTPYKLAADFRVRLDYSTLNDGAGKPVGYLINVVGLDNKAYGLPEVFRALLTTSETADLKEIFPYLMYCSTGTYGKVNEGTYNVSEEDYVYSKWANDQFKNPDIHLFPKAKESNAPKNISIAGIESTADGATVVLALREDMVKETLPGGFRLVVNGKETKVAGSNIPLGRGFRVVEMVYVYMDFPCTVKSGDKVSLKAMEGDKLDKVAWSIDGMTL